MRRTLMLATAILASLAAAGCFNPFSPTILSERVTTIAPSPNSPQNAVKLFEWCWVNRGVEEYKELFTADYVFLSAGTDSAGNPTREIQARRDDEIAIAQAMFIGSAERPPAARITLNFDQNLRPQRDTRPGYVDSLFKTIRTSVDLNVDIGDGTTLEVTGYALFFLVRGDTALIPEDLVALGFKKDKSRWWISRWEDETIASESVVANGERRARPAGSTYGTTRVTMAELKDVYRSPAAARAFAAANPGAVRRAGTARPSPALRGDRAGP
jgi:hypothetical protein